ncbi:MAG TPA: hypothetical protein VG099_12225, partial [Gemmataceae bacterium]|nr:hypothetical protein [Gemmataceae bacterium]
MRFNLNASRRRTLLALAATLSFLAIPGCGLQGDSGLNDTLADLQTKLTAAEKKVEDTIDWPPNDKAKEKAAA